MRLAGSLEYVEQEYLVFLGDCDVRRVYRTVYINIVKMVLCEIGRSTESTVEEGEILTWSSRGSWICAPANLVKKIRYFSQVER